MATTERPQNGSVIYITVIVAMLLMMLPMPDSWRALRPEWLLLTLMYWAMALPHRVGVGFAWVVGLLMDVMTGGALGVLAFSYALVIYMILHFHLQLRQFPVWQQALSLMAMILVVQIVNVVVSPSLAGWHVWLPAISSTILWPLFYIFLRSIRRSFNVS